MAEASETPARTVPTVGMLYAYLGHLKREFGDLTSAGSYLEQALELGEQSGYVEVIAVTSWALARLHRAQGDALAGLAVIERAIETVQEESLTVMRRLLLAERADLLVALDRTVEAETWAREQRVGEVVDLDLPTEQECLSLARLRLARGEVAEAARILERLLGPAEAAGRMGVAIEILVLEALVLQESGKLTPALNSLERALVLAEPEGYIRTFADQGEPMGALLSQMAARGVATGYAARLLAAIQGTEAGGHGQWVGSATLTIPALDNRHPIPAAEPLTAREIEVFRLLTSGASNQRIADALTVSVGTVKAHISHILGKIGVGNRTEAVAWARKFGLFDQE